MAQDEPTVAPGPAPRCTHPPYGIEALGPAPWRCETCRIPMPAPYYGSDLHPLLFSKDSQDRANTLIERIALGPEWQALTDLFRFNRDQVLYGVLRDAATDQAAIMRSVYLAQGMEWAINVMEVAKSRAMTLAEEKAKQAEGNE